MGTWAYLWENVENTDDKLLESTKMYGAIPSLEANPDMSSCSDFNLGKSQLKSGHFRFMVYLVYLYHICKIHAGVFSNLTPVERC